MDGCLRHVSRSAAALSVGTVPYVLTLVPLPDFSSRGPFVAGVDAGLGAESLEAGLESEVGLESDLESEDVAGADSEAGLLSLFDEGRDA